MGTTHERDCARALHHASVTHPACIRNGIDAAAQPLAAMSYFVCPINSVDRTMQTTAPCQPSVEREAVAGHAERGDIDDKGYFNFAYCFFANSCDEICQHNKKRIIKIKSR